MTQKEEVLSLGHQLRMRIKAARERGVSLLKFKEAGILFALLAMIVFSSILSPEFLSGFNIQILIRQIALLTIVAVGEAMIIIAGGIDLSVGSMLALSGVLLALFISWGWGMFVSILLVLAIGAGIGLFHGLAVTKVGITPFIVTLGTLSAARGLALGITQGWPIYGLPDPILFLGQGLVWGIPVPVIVMLAVVGIALFLLKYTTLGRYIYATGGNIEATRLCGINVNGVIIFTYVFAAILYVLDGIIIAGRLAQGQPGSSGGYELTTIAAVIIGGASLSGGEGGIWGVILGASILSVLNDSMVLLEVSAYWQQFVIGMVIVLAVVVDTIRRKKRV